MLLVSAVYASIDGKQCRLPAACSNIFKTLHWRNIQSIGLLQQWSLTWISFVDIKQTCLGQGLVVTITARKRTSKVKNLGHTSDLYIGHWSYAAWSSKLNQTAQ